MEQKRFPVLSRSQWVPRFQLSWNRSLNKQNRFDNKENFYHDPKKYWSYFGSWDIATVWPIAWFRRRSCALLFQERRRDVYSQGREVKRSNLQVFLLWGWLDRITRRYARRSVSRVKFRRDKNIRRDNTKEWISEIDPDFVWICAPRNAWLAGDVQSKLHWELMPDIIERGMGQFDIWEFTNKSSKNRA